ncbi:hypothetical protein BHE74_00041139 [Ensete ventricosum]|nr:hypothetical protein BHE74_00041139 [Ensete ventricosum]
MVVPQWVPPIRNLKVAANEKGLFPVWCLGGDRLNGILTLFIFDVPLKGDVSPVEPDGDLGPTRRLEGT